MSDPQNSRERDPSWDTLAAVCGYDPDGPWTKSERGRMNEALSQLREVTGLKTKEQRAELGHVIASKASAYRVQYPNVELTPTALASNWNRLRPSSERRAFKCPDCGVGFWSERSLNEHKERLHDEEEQYDRAANIARVRALTDNLLKGM